MDGIHRQREAWEQEGGGTKEESGKEHEKKDKDNPHIQDDGGHDGEDQQRHEWMVQGRGADVNSNDASGAVVGKVDDRMNSGGAKHLRFKFLYI